MVTFPDLAFTPEDLRAWRKEHKLSQKALAALLGVSLFTVWRWEAGQHAIPRQARTQLRSLAALYANAAHGAPESFQRKE